MSPTAIKSVRLSLALVIITLGLLVGGTMMAVKFATDHYLNHSASVTAHEWADMLARTVPDIENIARGEPPSRASMTFFEWARNAGSVYRYEIYNRLGYSQLIAEQDVEQVNLSTFSPQALEALQISGPVVWVGEGQAPGEPAFMARAFVPVLVDGRAVAVVGAYVDQTAMRADVAASSTVTALAMAGLAGLAFAIPALAWIWRTREKQQADRQIRFLALHDALTGLINRRSLLDKLQTSLAGLAPGGIGFAVHFIDLDRFKETNDSLGHDGGDFLLKAVADRLRGVTRAEDHVARLGGDEFVVVQSSVDRKETADVFAARMTEVLATPLQYLEYQIATAASIGVAMAPQDGATPDRLLKSADLALYRSKAEGRNRVTFFSPEMDAELQARLELERAIRAAVASGKFVLFYQPLFETPSGRLLGFEALVRLPMPDGTLSPPNTFIPVAEDMRLIGEIGAWVLHEACRTAAAWPSHLTIAVNLSPAQFEAVSMSEVVDAVLKQTGLAPERLELEITESLLLRDSDTVMRELLALKAMNVRIVMDDFGTGYSSLSYLWKFPFDKIKIDQSFMHGFDGTGRDVETVVKTIIALGRELRMQVTVEGVETAVQAAFIEEADPDQVQGFFFSRPMPTDEVAGCILADFRKRNDASGPALVVAQAQAS